MRSVEVSGVAPKSEENTFVDPTMAAQWLLQNHSNRSFKEVTAQSYESDMLQGRWRDVGDPIRFADVRDPETGEWAEWLIDGQHRLTAVVRSGVGQVFTVIRHLDLSDQLVLDSGMKRSLADTLFMDGHKNATRLAATARIIWQINQDESALTVNTKPSFSVLAEMISKDEDIVTAVDAVANMWTKVRFQPAVGAAVYYWGIQQAPDLTRDFYDRLASGIDLREGDPALALRNRLNYDKRIPRPNQLFLFLRASNVNRSGGRLAKIALPRNSKVSGSAIVAEVKRLTAKKAAPASDNE